jgi:hypothetical protein
MACGSRASSLRRFGCSSCVRNLTSELLKRYVDARLLSRVRGFQQEGTEAENCDELIEIQ